MLTGVEGQRTRVPFGDYPSRCLPSRSKHPSSVSLPPTWYLGRPSTRCLELFYVKVRFCSGAERADYVEVEGRNSERGVAPEKLNLFENSNLEMSIMLPTSRVGSELASQDS